MLIANIIVDAFAALGLLVFMAAGGAAALVVALARSDAGKALVAGLKKPNGTPPAE